LGNHYWARGGAWILDLLARRTLWAEMSDTTGPDAIVLFPASLVSNSIAGMNSPPSQTLHVLPEGSNATAWDLITYAPWLQVLPQSGAVPADVSVSINTSGLSPGVYTGKITFTSDMVTNCPHTAGVTLVLNPNVPVKVSTWRGAHNGAMSVSVDDGWGAYFDNLVRNGFTGIYVANGTIAPSFYPAFYSAGIDLGGHTASHNCAAAPGEAGWAPLEIEPNIKAICTQTPEPCHPAAWRNECTNCGKRCVL